MIEFGPEETARDFFLNAQHTFGLSPIDMGKLVIGKKTGYNHYKQWIIDSKNCRNPSLATVSHVKTLLAWHKLSPGTFKKHLEITLKALS